MLLARVVVVGVVVLLFCLLCCFVCGLFCLVLFCFVLSVVCGLFRDCVVLRLCCVLLFVLNCCGVLFVLVWCVLFCLVGAGWVSVLVLVLGLDVCWRVMCCCVWVCGVVCCFLVMCVGRVFRLV